MNTIFIIHCNNSFLTGGTVVDSLHMGSKSNSLHWLSHHLRHGLQ